MEEDEAIRDENVPLASDSSTTTTIKMLPKTVATQICTSQVIISAAGAARQLLDNAMDAGATNVEVTTLNFGVNLIRVTDDGSGIEEDNFHSLCKRHATSKITEYDDLLALSTLGFRGEALNALCALGSVTITTRTAARDVATRLHFDHAGMIERRETVPREVGTTVEVRALFTTLPVRRKEFERTAKREYAKMIGVVQEFALATPAIRFNVFSELSNGKRHHALSTAGGEDGSLGRVITDLFGGGAARNDVIEIKHGGREEEEQEQRRADDDDEDGEGAARDRELEKEMGEIRLDGFVSSPVHGNGRLTSDRQFVYINGRPVDYPKVCRAVNEIYQSHNRRQYPTLVLRIGMPADWVDVNVTPDKRLVFCQKERALLHTIRAVITAAFKPYENLMATLDKGVKKEVFSQSFASSPVTKSAEKSSKRKHFSTDSETGGGGGEDDSMLSRADSDEMDESRRMNNMLEELHAADWGLAGGGKRGGGVKRPALLTLARNRRSISPDHSTDAAAGTDADAGTGTMPPAAGDNPVVPAGFTSRLICQPQVKKARTGPATAESMGMRTLQSFAFKITPHVHSSQTEGAGGGEDEGENKMDMDARRRLLNRSYDEERERESELIGEHGGERGGTMRMEGGGEERVKLEVFSQQPMLDEQGQRDTVDGEDTVAEPPGIVRVASRKEQKLKCSLASILKQREEEEIEAGVGRDEQEGELEELREGPSAENEAAAEEQLRRAIRKSDFAAMEVVGQFNNGFIITKLNGHLFIVDQHASDEKANFEKFQKSAVVKNQETIRPQRLDVGAVAEAVVKDNIGIFNASGFHFKFPPDGSGAQLVSLPVVHGAAFDRKDIDELIAALTLHPGVMTRPTKLTKVFASKACRSSVMIGARLTREKMAGIVQQLGRLEHPWSCPHGRPTLRHLASLKKIEEC